METENAKAWKRVGNSVYAKSAIEANEWYTHYAEQYENDLKTLQCAAPEEVVRNALGHIDKNEEALLLDAAAGTGLCGQLLILGGYKGKLDAVEINGAMLQRAGQKGVYRKLIEFGIYADKPLPLESNSYDSVVCAGGFAPNHVEPAALKQLVRVLKPGGMIVFNTRYTEQNNQYRMKLEKVIQDLVLEEQLQELETKMIVNYHSKCNETENAMMSKLFVCTKLKM